MAEMRGWPSAVVRANSERGDDPVRGVRTAPAARIAVRPKASPTRCAEASDTIAAAAAGSTLLLMVDDAQELDDASSALLGLLRCGRRCSSS